MMMLIKWDRSNRLALILAMAAMLAAAPAMAQTLADVEYKIETSPTDPHPVTYIWAGENLPITDPGVHFYHPYYTGTVGPDARVPDGSKVDRVMVAFDEWVANRKWIITKLTLYYQITRNLEPGALYEMTGTQSPSSLALGMQPGAMPLGGQMPFGGAMGQPMAGPGPGANPFANAPPGTAGIADMMAAPQAPPSGANPFANAPPGTAGIADLMGGPSAAPQPPATPGFGPAEGVDPYVSGGMAGPEGGETAVRFRGGPLPTEFDPRLAAEWTFYYDQLVLWQYYCARNLLNSPDETLVDGLSQVFAEDPQNRILSEMVGTGVTGTPLNPQLGGGGMAAGGMGAPPGMQGMQGIVPGLGGMTPGADLTMAQARETFNPEEDYYDPDRNLAYRTKFQEAAQDKEQEIYTRFVKMILSIEDREANQEKYDQWIREKREKVESFAESWRKVDEGDTLMIDGQLFLVTNEPLDNTPYDAKNVVIREQLTPQDLLNPDGTLKRPDIQ